MSNIRQLDKLTIHHLSQEQYDRELALGTLDPNAIYLTPDNEEYASINHIHTKSQISDFPDSLPASDVHPWAKSESKPTYTKAEVGLSNVENTSDLDKPVSTATKSYIDTNGGKINKIKVNGEEQSIIDREVDLKVLPLSGGTLTGNLITYGRVFLKYDENSNNLVVVEAEPDPDSGNTNCKLCINTQGGPVDLYGSRLVRIDSPIDDTDAATKGYIDNHPDWNNKVDKVTGKTLSSNDYTTVEKTKLAGVADEANKYIHPSYTTKSSDLYKVSVDGTGHVNAATKVVKKDITDLGIPAQDTVYDHPASHPATMITQDATHRFVTDTEKTAWNAKSEFSGNYEDLAGKPDLDAPKKAIEIECQEGEKFTLTYNRDYHEPVLSFEGYFDEISDFYPLSRLIFNYNKIDLNCGGPNGVIVGIDNADQSSDMMPYIHGYVIDNVKQLNLKGAVFLDEPSLDDPKSLMPKGEIQTAIDTHANDVSKHVTAAEKTKWNNAADREVPTFTSGTTDLVAGTSPLANGTIHFVYE